METPTRQDRAKWLAERLKPSLDKLRSQSSTSMQRYMEWLILGNTAGAVLAFNASLSPTLCDREGLRLVGISFVAGLLLAIAASAIRWIANVFMANAMSEYFTYLDAFCGPEEPPSDEVLHASHTQMLRRGRTTFITTPIGILLMCLSLLSFCHGALLPLARPLTACVAGISAPVQQTAIP